MGDVVCQSLRRRNLTIYQPPIFFLKVRVAFGRLRRQATAEIPQSLARQDYQSQSWLTLYACLVLTQSSLASLSVQAPEETVSAGGLSYTIP